MTAMPSLGNFVPQDGRGRRASRNRNKERDAVMRMIFARHGFATEIARQLGMTHQNISAWNRVPPQHVQTLAELLDMTPEQIRPDIFGKRRRK